jgi:menaquinone-dependent protoporphyrinogen IX oxidase
MAKLLARKLGADTNTKQEHYEYTDWNTVTKFATDFVDIIEGKQ